MCGAPGSVPHTAWCTWCTGHTAALLHVVAEPSHVAWVVWWLKGSGRRAPTARGAQPAVRLCYVQARRAVGGSSTWQREQAVQSSMASTARMVPKPTSHSSITGSRSCSHSNVVGGWSLLHKLGAEMVLADDVAVRLRLLRNTLMHGACVPGRRHAIGCGTLAHEPCPERDSRASPKVNVLSAFHMNHSWNYPSLGSKLAW